MGKKATLYKSIINFIPITVALAFALDSTAQGCCSGGGGNPLLGNASAGVLQKEQVEVLVTHQYSRSNRFLSGSRDTIPFFDFLSSNYLFFKTEYGITDRLTLNVSTGYYINRTIHEFNDTIDEVIIKTKIGSSGFGDLILFPKYCILNKTGRSGKTEVTLGLGYKIPIGSHTDSTFIGYANFFNAETMSIDSTEIWKTLPPTVQTTTGSNDFNFYLFCFKSLSNTKLNMFGSALYTRKGWNSLGFKFGDYWSLNASLGYAISEKIRLLAQFRGEWNGTVRHHAHIDPIGLYNIDPSSTGNLQVTITPLLSFSIKENTTAFISSDIPLYQKMNGIQIGSQYIFSAGISTRFFATKKARENAKCISPKVSTIQAIETRIINVSGKCEMCQKKIQEIALSTDGVVFSNWDIENKELTVGFDGNENTITEIQRRLAKNGYDNDAYRATDKAYKNLHSCCRYERSIK